MYIVNCFDYIVSYFNITNIFPELTSQICYLFVMCDINFLCECMFTLNDFVKTQSLN